MSDDRWLEVAARILDGSPVAWDTLPPAHPDGDSVSVDVLRLIADVAEAHRSGDGLEPGRWGSLEILETIGHGTFGEVYRARDTALDRDVALKLLEHGRVAAPSEEGRLLARVRHPNVVTVHGAAMHDGRYGIWMEFVRGRTLAAIAAESGPLPAGEVGRIGIDVCHALDAVHASGLLHGDVKPQNVMCEDGGRIVLMDFGTGRLAADPGAASRLAGTPLYLAPEVLNGEPPSVQSDVYAAGVLLYYLLTGAYPVEGATLDDVRAAHASGTRVPVRARRPDIPLGLAKAIDRASAPARGDRFDSAAAFGAALAAAFAPRSVSRTAVFTVAASLLIAAAAGAGAWTWRATHPRPIAFKARDFVLVGAFENRTGLPRLDGVVEAAIERELTSSQFVNPVPRPRIDDVLQLMTKPVDTPLAPAIAREVCRRDGGIRAYLTGRVDKLGERYLLTASVFDPIDGRPVKSVAEEAANADALADALRRLTNHVRADLGESVQAIKQATDQLEKVTATSIDAVALYTQSYQFGDRNQWAPALDRAARAVATDEGFAMAHTWKAWCLRNTGAPPDAVLAEGRRAVDLSARVSEWERLWIEASYARFREDDEKEVALLIALVGLRPDHYWAVNNLSITLRRLGRIREGIPYIVRRADLRPLDATAATIAVMDLQRSGDLDGAQEYARRGRALIEAQGWDSRAIPLWLFPIEAQWIRGDVRGAAAGFDRLTTDVARWPADRRAAMALWLVTEHLSLGRPHAAAAAADLLPDANYRHFNRAIAAFHGGDRAVWHREMGLAAGDATGQDSRVYYLIEAGRFDEAQQWMDRRRAQADPGGGKVEEAHMALMKGNRRAAFPVLRDARPSTNVPQSVTRFELLADIYLRQGNRAQAIATLQQSLAYRTNPRIAHWWMRNQLKLAELYVQAGRESDARPLAAELERLLIAADQDFPLLVRLKALQAK